jgi:hypothetical protein
MWMIVFYGHQRLTMKKFYSICKKAICIDAEYFPNNDPQWNKFEISPCNADINITCEISNSFPELSNSIKSGDFIISVKGDTVHRAFPMGKILGSLTEYTPSDTSQSKTFFTPRSFPIMMDNRYIWSSLSLTQLLLTQNSLFIHASFIAANNKAILFSAPCGTGKSTQADLWKKYRNAEIINGDKAGILIENGIHACGVPFCGTSGICENKIISLGAIVLLSQNKTNVIKRLNGAEAFQAVMKNIYLDFIAPYERLKCTDLIIKLVSDVPVYHLACTPDENAVITLENTLKSEGVI